MTAVGDELIALYREAQDALLGKLDVAVSGSRAERRLRELLSAVAETRAQLEQGTRDWLTTRLPVLHAAGGSAAAEAVGSSFSWTQAHVDAVQALASQSWETMAAGLRDMEDSARTTLRSLARQSAREALIEGTTARQAAGDFAAAARQAGFATVTYSNGAVHSIADYSQAVIRTVTANSYNSGSITQMRDDGIGFAECADSDECGLDGHDDDVKPAGNVYPLDVADEFPISHVNCQRAWLPRPDVTSQDEADAVNSGDG